MKILQILLTFVLLSSSLLSSVYGNQNGYKKIVEQSIREHVASIGAEEYVHSDKVYKDTNSYIVLYAALGPCYDDKTSRPGSCGNNYEEYMKAIVDGVEYEPIKIGGKYDFQSKSVSYSNGIITIEGLEFAKGDPGCCPSLSRSLSYSVTKNAITRLENENRSKQEFFVYELFDNKFQAVFPGEPNILEVPTEYLESDKIIQSLPDKYKKDLTQAEIDEIVNYTIKQAKKGVSYFYSDSVNQVAYKAHMLPSGLEYKNYIWKGIQKQLDELTRDYLKAAGMTLIDFSSSLDKFSQTYTSVYRTSYFIEGQKIYMSSKEIYYKDNRYRWSVSYIDKKNKIIFDRYENNVKIVNN